MKKNEAVKRTTLSTVFGVITRTIIMLPLDYYVYGYLVSIVSGLSISEAYALILAALPGIILYNITVPLYAIPISYYIAKKMLSHYNSDLFKNSLFRENRLQKL